jgi:hypothetical protein
MIDKPNRSPILIELQFYNKNDTEISRRSKSILREKNRLRE